MTNKKLLLYCLFFALVIALATISFFVDDNGYVSNLLQGNIIGGITINIGQLTKILLALVAETSVLCGFFYVTAQKMFKS